MKQFDIITIFPEILDSYFNESLFKRGQKNKLVKIKTHNLRSYTKDKHKTVDAKIYGGGGGLLFKPDVMMRAIKGVPKKKNRRVILMSPTGHTFNQKKSKQLAKYDQLIFICPRYEGIDARVEKMVDEKISIGDYILTGGELGAAIIIDAVSRHILKFVGKEQSVLDESFSKENYLEYPQYTRPEVIKYNGKELKVPKVLLSGHHAEIEKWKIKQSKIKK